MVVYKWECGKKKTWIQSNGQKNNYVTWQHRKDEKVREKNRRSLDFISMTESPYQYVNNNKKHTYFDTNIFINLGTIIRKDTYDVLFYVLYIHYYACASKEWE